jgi:hypothetical protein
MEHGLKARILGNQFIEKLRVQIVVDRVEFDALCQCLLELVDVWRDCPRIDKEIVQELYVLAPVTEGVARSLDQKQPKLAREIHEMATRLDALVLQCFAQ